MSRCSLLFLRGALLSILVAPVLPSASAGVLLHKGSFEDGDAKLDGDGIKNMIVVWDAGTVHVVQDIYSVDYGYTLKIQPGAIVKLASTTVVDGNGNITSWKPPAGAGLMAAMADEVHAAGTLMIEGATLTDIRDDTEGGDSNGDGSSSTATNGFIGVSFGGSNADVLQNSKFKYIWKVGRFGSITVSNNHFIGLGSMSATSGFPINCEPVPVGATPTISNNTFDFVSAGAVDLRGYAAIVSHNTFHALDQDNVLQIGLRRAYAGASGTFPILPQTGTTDVSDNEFLGTGGVQVSALDYDSVFLKQPFSATITRNHFHHDVGDGNNCLSLMPDATIVVTANVEDNYRQPFTISMDRGDVGQATASGLEIHNNRFSFVSGGSQVNVADTFWHRGIRIHAQNNYWGDPSGPKDYSNADGVSNPRGLGIALGDGIDYIPFIGGTVKSSPDLVYISASTPQVPLLPKTTTTVSITVERLRLSSTGAGKLYALVKDATGTQINTPETIVNITSQSTTATIPPISITVPEFASEVSVELALVPDGDGEVMRSNTIALPVLQPPNAFRFLGVYDPTTGWPISPLVIPGAVISGRADFRYTHVASPVTFDITIQERDKTGHVLSSLIHDSFTVPAGTDLDANRTFSLTIPIRDVVTYPVRNLYGIFTATDGAGNRVGGTEGSYPIFVGVNTMNIKTCLVFGAPGAEGLPTGRQYVLPGDRLTVGMIAEYLVASPNVNDWQIVANATAYDAAGNVAQDYPSPGPAETGISTSKSTQKWAHALTARPTTPVIPENARHLRVRMLLTRSNGEIMAIDSIDLPVRPKPAAEVGALMKSGASNLAFSPIPVSLSITSNQTGVEMTAQEFHGQFMGTSQRSGVPSTQSFGPNDYWAFTPLNRWYGIFDTLKSFSVQATLSIGYEPATDFPSNVTINEDSLVICGYNYLSRSLEALPTTINKSTHTASTAFTSFFDTYVVATRSTGVMSDVREIGLAQGVMLDAPYPSPSDNRALIHLRTDADATVRVDVIDVAGRTIATLHDGAVHSGVWDLVWNCGEFSAGCYYVRAVSRTGSVVQPVLVSRLTK